MSSPRFRLVLRDGRALSGVVQGAGGPIVSLLRLDLAIFRAQGDRPTGLYEPIPGHCVVYEQFRADRNGPATMVDLRQVRRTAILKSDV